MWIHLWALAAATQPNIVFFMADDLGWANVGWHAMDMHTPNTKTLVEAGLSASRAPCDP
jgi:arylsulfatase A-like enzyme